VFLKAQVLILIPNCIITANISEIKEKNGKSIANNGRVWYYNFENFKQLKVLKIKKLKSLYGKRIIWLLNLHRQNS